MQMHCSEQQNILNLLEQQPDDEPLIMQLEHHFETCSNCRECEAKLHSLWQIYKRNEIPLTKALEQRLRECIEQKSA